MNQSDPNPTGAKTHYEPGTAIRGEKVTAQARRIQKPTLCEGTSAHRIQQTKLEGSVFCVIDRPLNYLRNLPLKPDT